MPPETESGEVVTHVVRSRGKTEIDLSDVIAEGKITVFPHVMENPDLLAISFFRNKVRLSAGKFIGLIPLAPRVLVDVHPKLPISNLAHVLDVAKHPIDRLIGVTRTYLETDLSSDSIADFLTANLLSAVREIQGAGLFKEYVRQSASTSYPRGRIDLTGTVKNCWSRGRTHQATSSSFVQTADNPPNRLIKHALAILLRSRADDRSDPTITSSANQLYGSLPSSIGRLCAGDRLLCQTIVDRRSLPGSRSYYYRALEISLMVLEGRGISFQSHGADVTLDTSIIDFETVFEDYVRRVLQRSAGNSVIVQDGNSEGKRPLYDDRENPPAQPDIVLLSAAGGQPVVADVKYKDKPDRDDVNQAVTYAVVYRARKAVLIHQNKPKAPSGLSRIGTIDNIEVYAYAINLDNPDLVEEEQSLSQSLFGLI